MDLPLPPFEPLRATQTRGMMEIESSLGMAGSQGWEKKGNKMAEVVCTANGETHEVAARTLSTVDLFLTLDEVVHQRTRLAVLCVLRWRGELDFNTLRDALALSDGNLARHVTVLRASDLVDTTKRTEGRRRRTYITATEQGVAALDAHLDAIANILAVHQSFCSVAISERAG